MDDPAGCHTPCCAFDLTAASPPPPLLSSPVIRTVDKYASIRTNEIVALKKVDMHNETQGVSCCAMACNAGS